MDKKISIKIGGIAITADQTVKLLSNPKTMKIGSMEIDKAIFESKNKDLKTVIKDNVKYEKTEEELEKEGSEILEF